jgi:hypothetical protein
MNLKEDDLKSTWIAGALGLVFIMAGVLVLCVFPVPAVTP